MTLAAMVGNVALLNSTVLTTTRMGLLPWRRTGIFPRRSRAGISRYGTPWLAIVVSAVIYALLAWAEPGAADLGVYLAALGDDGVDGAFGMEVAGARGRRCRARL